MKYVIPRPVSVGFFAVLIIVVISALLPYSNGRQLLTSENWVNHTITVLGAIDSFNLALVEAETSERGYLVTGNLNYLTLFKSSSAEARERIANLKKLVGDYDQQEGVIARLEELTEAKIIAMQQIVDIHAAGRGDEAIKRVEDSNQFTEEIRYQLRSMRDFEKALLANRTAEAKALTQDTLWSFLIATVIKFVLVAGLFWYIYDSFKKRQMAEESLQRQTTILRSVLDNMSEGIAFIDIAGKQVLHNPALKEMLGEKSSSQIDADQWQSHYNIYCLDGSTPFATNDFPIVKVLNGALSSCADMIIGHSDNQRRIIRVNARPIFAEDRKLAGSVAVVSDFTRQAQAEQVVNELNLKLRAGLQEVTAKNEEVNALVEMSGLLQSCLTLPEAYTIFTQSIEKLLPALSGAIYILPPAKGSFELVKAWGAERKLVHTFGPHSCWCVRRHKFHLVSDTAKDILCEHLNHEGAPRYPSICSPITAHGEVIGVLLLQSTGEAIAKYLTISGPRIVMMLCDQAGLSFANLKLREVLQAQSNMDELTGLYNRRFLETTLQREIALADRQKQSLALFLLDVDHFKKFNDTHGHEAGDLVLKSLGRILQESLRATDLPCRYGGEEFVILLPGATPEIATECAERVLEAIRNLQLNYGGHVLQITASIGIAAYPHHCASSTSLIRIADQCLYHAKHSGRDRQVMANPELLTLFKIGESKEDRE